MYVRARTPTRTPPAVRQPHARTHAHAGAFTHTGVRAHTRPAVQPNECRSTHTRTRTQTRGQASTLMCTCACAQPHAHAHHTRAREQTHNHAGARAHTSAHSHLHAPTARASMGGRVCTAGRRRCIWPLSTASTTRCGCSSPTARTPPRETTKGSFGGERTPSTHARDVPLVLPSGRCRRRVRALGPFSNWGCYLGIRARGGDLAIVRLALSRRRCARHVSAAHATAQPLQAYSAMPMAS
jgi:hypothetical protein